MAFRLEDFKKTSRKGAGDAPASVYPHQIKITGKDKKMLARLEVALRTFDQGVGQRRRDLDAQAMTDFFGDPRLARGVVACLGRFYGYETPTFAQSVGKDAAARLTAAGLTKPVQLRAQTYAHVNALHGGFLPEARRAAVYEALAEPFGLTPHQWDLLLSLDAEENQLLTRRGARPAPETVAALYHFHSLDTVLKRATAMSLSGSCLSSAEAADVRALGAALGVKIAVGGGGTTVTLTGDGANLSRALLLLLHGYGERSVTGWVDAKFGPKLFRLTLTTEALAALGMPRVRPVTAPRLARRLEAAAAVYKDFLRRRARGQAGVGGADGWRLMRRAEPLVTAGGVLLPEFRLLRGDFHAAVCLGAEPGGEWGEPVLTVPLGRKDPDAQGLLDLAEAEAGSLFALPPVSTLPPVPADVRALCDRAAREGLVRAGDARKALHLLDESPLIDWVRQCGDARVRYVPGVGLCSNDLVERLQVRE